MKTNGPVRRLTTTLRVANPATFIANLNDIEENKLNLEDLHSNRNFSLATTLM